MQQEHVHVHAVSWVAVGWGVVMLCARAACFHLYYMVTVESLPVQGLAVTTSGILRVPAAAPRQHRTLASMDHAADGALQPVGITAGGPPAPGDTAAGSSGAVIR